MKLHNLSYMGGATAFLWAGAILLAETLTAQAGPKEDGDAAFKAGKMPEAEAAYTQALAAKPDDVHSLIRRGRARDTLGRESEAAADFDQAVRVAPNSPDAWHYRGILRYKSKDYKGALEDLNKGAELSPQSASAFESRATVEIALKDYNAAIVDCTRAIQIKPDFILALNWRGYAWQQVKDQGSALRDFETVIKLDPRNTYALTRRATIYEARGEKEAAAREYRVVLALDPKEKDAANRLAALQKSSTPAPGSSSGVKPPAHAPAANTIQGATTPGPTQSLASTTTQSQASAPNPSVAPESAATTGQGANPSKSTAANGPAPQPTDVAANKPQSQTSEAKTKDQSKPSQPALPVATVVPTPSTGYFKLVKVELGFAKDGTLIVQPGLNTVGSWTNTWNLMDANRTTVGEDMRWSVPNALVPDVPVKFHLEMSILDVCYAHARITLMAVHQANWYVPKYMVCVRNWPKSDTSEPVQSNLTDDFELTLPKELPGLMADYMSASPDSQFWKAQSGKNSFKMRDQRGMDDIGGFNNSQVKTTTTPDTLPLEDCHLVLRDWLSDLEVEVACDDKAPFAKYTYTWVGPGSGHSLEFSLLPGPKKDLRADGQDGVYVRARVNPKDDSEKAAAAAATAGITFSAGGADSGWVDLNYKPEMRDGWMVTMVQASNPDAARKGYVKPPATVTVAARAQKGNAELTQSLDIPIAPDADIDAKPDLVEFTSGSGDSAKVAVGIDNAGPDKWEFHADYDKDSRKVAAADLKAVDGKSATIALKEAGLDPQHDGTNKEQALLKITAEQKGRATLERDIKVNVYQEGLFVSTDGRDPDKGIFVLNGDGKARPPTEIDVRVYTKDPKTKKIVNVTAKEGGLKKLTVERLDPKGTPASNVLEVGKFDGSFTKVRQVNDPAAVLSLSLPKEVPADGRIVPCDFRISYSDEEGASFSSIITVGVQTTSDGPGGSNWQVELDKCQEVVTKFVPATYYPKMQAMLDKRKMTLGPEGLAQLRHKIWNAAAELTLGEGGEGYANEAAWAGAITDVLEWSQWAGDMAFDAAIGTWTGPYGAAGADMLKGAVVSAINAYQDGETPQQWAYENLISIRGMLRGQVVDPSVFEKMGVGSKTKAWSVYLGYHFLANLYDGQTVVEALKNTGKEATNYVIGGWLSEQVKQNAGKEVAQWAGEKGQEAKTAVQNLLPKAQNPQAAAVPKETAPTKEAASTEAALTKEASAEKPAAEGEPPPGAAKPEAPAVESTPAQESDAAALVRSRATEGPDGRLFAHQDDVLTIMKDPTMVRALKNAPAEVQEAFSNTREQIYEQHDSVVEQYVRTTVDGMSKRVVKVREFRTPGATGASLNTDRDYRVCYFAGWDKNGLEQWIEIPRKQWQDKSYETFAKLTGCPDGYKGGPETWAADHQQLATDKSHAEASVAFSDQLVYNKETKQMEKIRVVSNIQQVSGDQQKQKWNSETKQWDTVPEDPALAPVAKPDPDNTKIDLADPQGLGLMYQDKVLHAQQPQEAFVQANKAVETLVALRKAYKLKDRPIGNLAPNVEAGMKAVAEVVAKLKADPNCRDPKAVAEAQNTLRKNGFPNIGAFMDKLGGQFESFKNM